MHSSQTATQLVETAIAGDAEGMARLLAEDTDIDAFFDEERRTALAIAASMGNAKAVRTLLAAGADPETADDRGRTALHHAAESGDPASVAALLAAQADVDRRDEYGQSPLHVAVSRYEVSEGNEEIVRILLAAGASVRGSEKMPGPLFLALGRMNPSRETVAALIAAGADSNEVVESGYTPLILATQVGATPIVEMLLRHGADPNLSLPNQDAALNIAREEGHDEIASLLTAAGATPPPETSEDPAVAIIWDDVEAFLRLSAERPFTDEEIRRLLFLAIDHWGRPEILRRLLDLGASPNAIDSDETLPATALLRAVARNNVNALRVLLDAGAEPGDKGFELMLQAGEQGSVEMIDILLGAGVPVDATDGEGSTALMVAVYDLHLAAVRHLLRRGANVNAQTLNVNPDYFGGATPLIYAAKRGDAGAEVARILLDAGADVDARDAAGNTVLMWAAFSQSPRMVELILDSQPDVRAKDRHGRTALDHAYDRGSPPVDVLELLRAAGVPPSPYRSYPK